MSDKNPENPSAFPNVDFQQLGSVAIGSTNGGMTLRDYFAAAALNGMLSAHAIYKKVGEPKGMAPPEIEKMTADEISRSAYQCADAMLREREKC